jgi:hypothetical protein
MAMPQCDLLLVVATPTEQKELEAAARARGWARPRRGGDGGDRRSRDPLGAKDIVVLQPALALRHHAPIVKRDVRVGQLALPRHELE